MPRILYAVLIALPVPAVAQTPHPPSKQPALVVTSPDVKSGAKIPEEHAFNAMGCNGQNISPAVEWKGAPPKTKSFALTMYDPDAPTGSGFWHWIVYNIPANITKLEAGAGDPGKNLLPQGAVQGNTDIGKPGYVGPCPPQGETHHYQITVFALDVDTLDVQPGATAAIVGFNMHFHTVTKGRLTAIYRR
ncbi:MAG TPA: YbhB/YbcL family Raf kinase inhibitor-like protein [Gemmatimonadales bacterium]|nr:YbhB/YbcL family Raf kinase inhibitor-like protein [Gemmatimonadales bacterium]